MEIQMLSHIHIRNESVNLRTVPDVFSDFIELALHSVFMNLDIAVLEINLSSKSFESA